MEEAEKGTWREKGEEPRKGERRRRGPGYKLANVQQLTLCVLRNMHISARTVHILPLTCCGRDVSFAHLPTTSCRMLS